MDFQGLFSAIDPYIIWFYRLTGYTFIDFLIGTLVLAFVTLLIGEFTISLAFLANREAIQKNNDDIMRYQHISVSAIEEKDKKSYTAANKLANDAFGKSFFHQIALSTGFLWPIPFALGWMQHRFVDVDFRILFTNLTVQYPIFFFSMFALCYIAFKRIKYRLPYFRRIGLILENSRQQGTGMRTWENLLARRQE